MAKFDFNQFKTMDKKAAFLSAKSGTANALSGNLAVPIFLIAMLGLMTLPIPPFLLDVFFTFNMALSFVVLLVSIYVLRPLDFAVFPTILLVATLLRLSLNVASTRVVLLYGHDGGDAAGDVIQAFGEVLIGGNYAVGLVVFTILMIINFVVVTKGAGRVSEVSARFTLDAMPGKQMAIDADMNAGLIDADTAKIRRDDVAREADFYGSMDGASKFVRGDAVAGLLILFINIIGGLGVGILQHDLEFNDAVTKYALLTIGDGLVAQIPSLLLSVAAAIMVTRNTTSEAMGEQVMGQMFNTPKALVVTAVIMISLGLMPGMPHIVFLLIGGGAAYGAWYIWNRDKKDDESIASALKKGHPAAASSGGSDVTPGPAAAVEEDLNKEITWDDVQPVDMVGLEVGYRLIPLVDKSQGGQLLARIKGVRKKLSQEVGFLMPSIHIRDNLDLMPNAYRITLMGVSVADAEIFPDRDMAINPGQVFGEVDGIKGKDPAFGLDAIWIESHQKDQAQTLGYTVVDASTVVATHVNQVLLKHSYELLGHEEVQELVNQLAKSSPKLAEALIPNALNISQLLKVLQNLLVENVPIRDMRTVAEALTNIQPSTTDPMLLTAAARVGLSRMIVQSLVGNELEIPVITFDKELEQLLLRTVQQAQNEGNSDTLMLEPSLAERIQQSLLQAIKVQEEKGQPSILLVSPQIRMMIARFLRYSLESLSILSFQEVPDNKQITVVATVGK
jgi:flagellar biosynthesis protein FlhA